MSFIQDEFDRVTGDFIMTSGEYEGPLTITRPCVVDGQNSTLWAENGPVLIVDSTSVTLKNLRIEVTENPENSHSAISLQSNYADVVLVNVEINGSVKGLPGETAKWEIPGIIALGDFAANKENSFSIEFDAPSAAEIVHNIKDVIITPNHIKQGRNTIGITTTNMRDNTILFGEILLKTGVSRRIYITGKAKKGAPEHTASLPISGALTISTPLQIDPPDEVIAPVIPDNEQIKYVKKGQRISLGQTGNTLKLVYSHKSERHPLVVDPYIFLLGKNGKVRSDNDLIFFGKEESENHEARVKVDSGNAFAVIDLSNVSSDIEKIVICLSIYDDEYGSDFTCVTDPLVRVFSDEREQFRFMLNDLSQEKTVVAAEVYRYKGEWKVSFVGGSFKSGLEALCREYGVDVES